MSKDNLFESDPTTMLAKADGIALWSEAKKDEFVKLFDERVRAARYILVETAVMLKTIAMRRRFISEKSLRKVHEKYGDHFGYALASRRSREDLSRPTRELDGIAEERAKAIISELPPLKTAVQVIDKKVAEKIARIDELRVLAQEISDQMEDVTGSIRMSEVDQKMTIGDFRSMLQDRETTRRQLLASLKEYGEEGTRLEKEVAAALYEGLPGLTDAIVSAIEAHLERAVALGETGRRVEEQVKFGDSEAAMSILKTFEEDEARISDELRDQLSGAMAVLKNEAKALRAAKRKAKRKTTTKKKKGT